MNICTLLTLVETVNQIGLHVELNDYFMHPWITHNLGATMDPREVAELEISLSYYLHGWHCLNQKCQCRFRKKCCLIWLLVRGTVLFPNAYSGTFVSYLSNIALHLLSGAYSIAAGGLRKHWTVSGIQYWMYVECKFPLKNSESTYSYIKFPLKNPLKPVQFTLRSPRLQHYKHVHEGKLIPKQDSEFSLLCWTCWTINILLGLKFRLYVRRPRALIIIYSATKQKTSYSHIFLKAMIWNKKSISYNLHPSTIKSWYKHVSMFNSVVRLNKNTQVCVLIRGTNFFANSNIITTLKKNRQSIICTSVGEIPIS